MARENPPLFVGQRGNSISLAVCHACNARHVGVTFRGEAGRGFMQSVARGKVDTLRCTHCNASYTGLGYRNGRVVYRDMAKGDAAPPSRT